MRTVVLACEHACAGACPDRRRRVARHPSRTSAVTTRARGKGEEGGRRDQRGKKRERWTGDGVGSRGVEGTKE